MAFPVSPIDGQLYSNALGTQYKYVAADGAWKISGQSIVGMTGIQGVTGIGSTGGISGTQYKMPYFATSSTLGDTYLTYNTGNGAVDMDVASVGTSLLTIWNSDVSNTSVNKASNDTGTAIASMVAYGSALASTYQSPDGTALGNNSEFQFSGARWTNFNQIYSGALTYFSYKGYALAHYDNEKFTVDKCLNVGDATSLDARLVVQSNDDSVPIVEIVDNAPVNGNTSIRSKLPQCDHGMTDWLPTDVNWEIRSCVKGTGYKDGGMMIETCSSGIAYPTFQIHAIGPCDQIYAPISLYGAAKYGTGQTDVSSASPLFTITNNTTPALTMTGNGDATFAGKVVTGSTWNGAHLVLGVYHIWVDGIGSLRIKSGAPTSDTDGVTVGSQS